MVTRHRLERAPQLRILLLLALMMVAAPARAEAPPRWLITWGTTGTSVGEFDAPYHITLDKSGMLYVTDSENHRIQKFDSQGNYVGSWGGTPYPFSIPSGIAIDSEDRVWVTDADNNQIQVFNLDGQFLFKFGEQGGGPGRFYLPIGLVFDQDGFLYLADSWNNRIQKFDAKQIVATQGAQGFVKAWGGPNGVAGTAPGYFDLPTGVAIDQQNRLLVTDTRNHRVQLFDLEGNYLGQIGRGTTESSNPGQFNLPYAVDVGPDGRIYICDSGNDRVQVFEEDLSLVITWGGVIDGTGNGEFNLPWGIAVAPNGDVFVSDAENDRMQKFGALSVPTVPSTWGRLKQSYLSP